MPVVSVFKDKAFRVVDLSDSWSPRTLVIPHLALHEVSYLEVIVEEVNVGLEYFDRRIGHLKTRLVRAPCDVAGHADLCLRIDVPGGEKQDNQGQRLSYCLHIVIERQGSG